MLEPVLKRISPVEVIRAAEPSVTVPFMVLVLPDARNAPPPATPSPFSVIASVQVDYAQHLFNVARRMINCAAAVLPKPELSPIRNVPSLIVVVPEYVFVPDKVSLPAPCLTRLPVPEITLPTVTSLLRSKRSVALLMIPPVPSEPVVPPAPGSATCRR
nr:hypothetical protein [Roseicyclus sp.]